MKTHANDRTNSRRKRAGSQRNKKLRNVGFRRSDDRLTYVIGEGTSPNHQARAVDIDRVFPQLGSHTH